MLYYIHLIFNIFKKLVFNLHEFFEKNSTSFNGIYIYYISLIIYIIFTYFQFLHHKTLRDNFQTIIHHYYQKKKKLQLENRGKEKS